MRSKTQLIMKYTIGCDIIGSLYILALEKTTTQQVNTANEKNVIRLST